MEFFTDIHSHIIPSLDDGAEGMDQAIRMLRIARDNYIRRIIATPHYILGKHNRKSEDRTKALETLREAAKQEAIDIELYMGNEIYYRNAAIQLLAEGEICTLAGSSYVLIEFNPMQDYPYIRDAVYNLHAEGYRPILAHAERYKSLMEKKERLQDIIGMGGYIQVNAGSFIKKFGYAAKKDALWMLKEDCVHFLATDSHNDKDRAPYLAETIKYIEKKVGKQEINRLLCENPDRVLRNEYV